MSDRPIAVFLGNLATASANNIAASQTPTAAAGAVINGALVATGNTALMDVARRVVITPTGDESGNTFTIRGTDRFNTAISELMTGGNAAATQTKQDFKTVNNVALAINANNAVTIGTSNTASSAWIKLNRYGLGPVSFGVDLVSGACNFKIEATMDDPDWAYTTGVPKTGLTGNLAGTVYLPVPYNHPTVAGNTATTFDGFGYVSTNPKPFACRVTINTGSGAVLLNVIESGLATS